MEPDDAPTPVDPRRHYTTHPPGTVIESDIPPVVDLGMAQEIDIKGHNWKGGYPNSDDD
jgi:hypothetical protein